MILTTKKIAEYTELINNALDNIPVKNKKNFLRICQGLQNILQTGNFKPLKDKEIQEHLSDIADMLNEPAFGYADQETFRKFQEIIRTRISVKIKEFQSMTESEKTRYIEEQQQKIKRILSSKAKLNKVANDPNWKQKQQRYNTGEEETYDQMLRRMEQEFQTLTVVPIVGAQAPQEIRNRYGEVLVTRNELASLSIETRTQFFRNSTAINILISQLRISFEQLSQMRSEIRNELIENAEAIETLCTYRYISIEKLIALEPAIRKELIINSHSFMGLNISRNLSIDELTRLNIEEVHTLLSNPNSLESRFILEDIESSRRRFKSCSIS